MGFPGSSAGKESAFNAGDPGLIPGSGRFPGEGIGYPVQYSWASLVAQMVKNLPAVLGSWRTGHFKLMEECFPGGSDGKESACNAGDPGSIPDLERSPGEGNGTHSSILGLPWWLRW